MEYCRILMFFSLSQSVFDTMPVLNPKYLTVKPSNGISNGSSSALKVS